MIHPPDVIVKYAPDAVIGALGAGGDAAPGAEAAAPTAAVDLDAPLLKKGGRYVEPAHANKSRDKRMKEYGKIPGFFGALCYMVLNFMKETVLTIFGQKNLVLTNDRVGLTRSAMFLFVFIVIHAIGNLHVFLGPDDFNGYGYFYVRLYFTGLGLPANIVEEYVLLAALLHVIVGLKRTWDISINYTVASGKLNLAFSGVALLTFMTIHLFQFRFGETQQYMVRPPPYFINVEGILSLNLFYTWDASVAPVAVRNIYKLEFDVFQSSGWVLAYISAVCVFATHMCLGWQKAVGAPMLEIPKRHQAKAAHVGYVMTAFVALIYVSFPIYCYMSSPSGGCLGNQFEGPSSIRDGGVWENGNLTHFGASAGCVGW